MGAAAADPPALPSASRVAELGLLDAAPMPALLELVRRARDVGRFPIAWLSLFDGATERLVARVGFDAESLPVNGSLALARPAWVEPLFVADARESAWRDHPLVACAPHARFIGIVPLACADGLVVGTLTVIDREARDIGAAERAALANLAALAAARLEGRRERPGPKSERGVPHGTSLEVESRRRAAAEAALDRERALLEAVLDSLASAFFLLGPDQAMLRWNASLAAAIGYADAEIPRLRATDLVSPHDRPQVEAALREVFEHGREVEIEAEIVDRAGNVRPYSLSGKPVQLGGVTYMIGVASDITLRKRAERQMARAKERLDLALSGSRLALWDWDLAHERVYFNESWPVLLGGEARECTFSSSEVIGWNHPQEEAVFAAALGNALKGVSDGFDCEYRVRDAHGEWVWIHARGRVTQRDAAGRALRMTGTSTNVNERKRAEERAEYLATRDALTTLPNRVLLHDRLEQAISSGARHQTAFAFMFIDLDRFKTINDSLGHQAGDELLKGVASRLQASVRATDTVARLGGDEFAVILENLREDDHEGAQQVAEKMIEAMGSPLLVGGQPLTTSCSIGISLYPADGRDSATLMKNADVAMYHAKEKGRNNYQFFSPGMNARAQERLAVESYLRLALRRNELTLHYQPRVSLATGELVAVEALIRWMHPRRGLLDPAKFIDVAEDSGLIVPIGEWALEAACAQAARWQARLRPGLRVSVNLSVRQVRDGERLYAAVERSLRNAGLAASTLELELTESHLMQDIGEKAALLKRLGDLGVGLAIDDFGTGYSSLSYLKKLPIDAIKIDGSFVRDMAEDPNDEAIIQAIIAMAHSLELIVVAEGVETAAQHDALRALGCDEYQGFHASAALAPADFEKRYARR